MGIIKLLFGFLFLIFAVAFTYYNLHMTEVKFYNFSLKLPMFIFFFLSVGIGFSIPTAYFLLREKALKKREEKILQLLNFFWRDYLGKAFDLLRKFLLIEEFMPFYIRTKKEFGESLDVQLDLYNKGIAETALAELTFRKDLDEARILLENALGKNQKNQRARKMLRSIYMVLEDYDKAEELQRQILKEIEKERKVEEQRVLASILAEKYSRENEEVILKELWSLPVSKTSGALLSSMVNGGEVFEAAFNLGILPEVIKIMEERNLLQPELLNLIENNYRSAVPDYVLYYVYLKLNMKEKLKELNVTLPELKLVKDKSPELLELVDIWECEECGKEYNKYTSVCRNCLGVNTLKIKRVEEYDNRPL
ncbi:tetratricopeptide repeat protein [Aquifex aeolicus]|uniref:Lipopolysaccharide assembly protein A domain-containing protein n=1 Tax=Aquifex aeolicus (strain VF5) TaxID=224324 RepID=O67508_AQUAE|nr:hypothetical protein [Aquifex aeolicus]AAC07471.1 putative protein [Aquifex aeolicus VF5]